MSGEDSFMATPVDGPQQFPCPYCGMSFPTTARLQRHTGNIHPDDQVIILDIEVADDQRVSQS